MSVLIKGMEMPDGCNTCQLRDLRFNYYVCRAKKLEDGFYLDVDDVVGRRHRYCPLVEVPTPHGRLIDADYLKKDRINIGGTDFVLLVDVDNAKTIIEAEVSE